jgi:hypothetical protein
MEEEKEEKGRENSSQDFGNREDFTIYKARGGTEEEDNKKSNKIEVKIADSGSSGVFMFSPKSDHKGTIDYVISGGEPIYPQSLCVDGHKGDDNDYTQSKACIGRDGLSLISYDCNFLSIPRENLVTQL